MRQTDNCAPVWKKSAKHHRRKHLCWIDFCARMMALADEEVKNASRRAAVWKQAAKRNRNLAKNRSDYDKLITAYDSALRRAEYAEARMAMLEESLALAVRCVRRWVVDKLVPSERKLFQEYYDELKELFDE